MFCTGKKRKAASDTPSESYTTLIAKRTRQGRKESKEKESKEKERKKGKEKKGKEKKGKEKKGKEKKGKEKKGKIPNDIMIILIPACR